MKNISGIIGLVLLIVFIAGGNYLTNWSTAELVGYNLVSLAELVGGAWLVYSGLKSIKK